MKKILLLLLMCAVISAYGQKKKPRGGAYSREISSTFENDIFFLIDYYYTAGMDLTYRRMVDPSSRMQKLFNAAKSDSGKVIIAYQAGFKIYNPRDIDEPRISTMDRPYAGWSFVRFGISNFPTDRAMNRYEIEAGVVGKESRMGQFQRWVHHVTNFEIPKGWDSQIRNEAIGNLYYSRYQQIPMLVDLDLISESSVKAGTGGNKISQDVTFRMFQFNNLSNSVFTQSRTSWDDKATVRRQKLEAFFIFGYGIDYVLTDVVLGGSVFPDHKSVFTVNPRHVVLRRNYGFMFSSRSISWSLNILHISKEMAGGTGHIYGSVGLAVRF